MLVGVCMVVGSMTSACGGRNSDDPRAAAPPTTATITAATISVDGQPVAVSLLADAVAALCVVVDRARGGDQAGAAAEFFDHAHDPLHTLARAIEEVDRPGAARLLEAKEEVESDLDDGSDPNLLAAAVKELQGKAADGLGRLGIEAPACGA